MAEQTDTSARKREAERQESNRRLRAVEQASRANAAGNSAGGRINPTADVAALLRGEDIAPATDNAQARNNPPREDFIEDDEPAGAPPPPPGEGEQDADGEAAEADEAPAQPDKPATIDDVAKLLNMTKADLNAVEVAVGHERMTLGELKAKLPELAKLDKSRAEFEDGKADWELQRIDSLRRISAIVERFPPGSVPPQVLAAIEADHQHTRARESALLTTARKEWSDPVYAASERQRMTDVAKRYGFTAGEVASVMDHRQVLLLQDFAKLQAKFDEAKAQARRDANADPGQARSEGAPQSSARRTSTRADQAARVGQLLRR